MNREKFLMIEKYMRLCMKDSAHGWDHVYRVLYNALEIAKTEEKVDTDVLICACLLHDIGRKEQFENPELCHAMVGSEKAYQFLIEHGFDAEYACKVKHCVETHRFRKNNPPRTLEAKILFDADKLEAAGAVGIARTLIYKGIVSDPLYSLRPDGTVSDGDGDTEASFFQEYKYKLEHIYDHFYTRKGAEMAEQKRGAAVAFYESLLQEVKSSYENGNEELERLLDD